MCSTLESVKENCASLSTQFQLWDAKCLRSVIGVGSGEVNVGAKMEVKLNKMTLINLQ